MARTAKTTHADDPAQESVEAATKAMTKTEPANRAPRPGSKLAAVLGLLEGETGATITEIMTAVDFHPELSRFFHREVSHL